ncbi:MAG TPA: hypothetical protein VMU34_18285 [Mycobacterium sp.]|nr:hypothetical protein [Mycobacterium sp.]
MSLISRRHTPDEAGYIVRDSGAEVVIAPAGVAGLAEQLVRLLPEITHWYAFDGAVAGHRPYPDLLASAGAPLTDQPRAAEMLYGHHRLAQRGQTAPDPDPG